jgi:hypothetical protein
MEDETCKMADAFTRLGATLVVASLVVFGNVKFENRVRNFVGAKGLNNVELWGWSPA